MKSQKVIHHPGYDGTKFSTVEDELEERTVGPTPGASTDHGVARWDGTTGRLLEDSGVIVDDSNNLATAGKITAGSATNGASVLNVKVGTQSTDGGYFTGGDTHDIKVLPSNAAGNFNPTVQVGDGSIIYSGGSAGTGALVVAPWNATGSGYRMDANGVATFSSEVGFGEQTLTDASPITWNARTQQTAYVLLTSGVGATRQLSLATNLKAGFTYILRVQQSSTGSNALTYASGIKFPNGVAFVLSTANNAIDILTFYSDGSNMYGVGQKAFS